VEWRLAAADKTPSDATLDEVEAEWQGVKALGDGCDGRLA